MLRDEPVKILPDVRAWSDVIFLEWETQAQASGQDIKGLKYVVRFEVANKDTVAIVIQGVGPLNTIKWPGKTIPMSDERGQAILGTPNGVGVAYLLATHKAQMGQKTVESVQVWSRLVQRPAWAYTYVYAAFKIGPVGSSSSSGLSCLSCFSSN
jgi:hypothetical protein